MAVETTKTMDYSIDACNKSDVDLLHKILGELACAEHYITHLFVFGKSIDRCGSVADIINTFSVSIDFNTWPNFVLFEEALLFVEKTGYNEWGDNHIWNVKFNAWRKRQ